MAHNAAKGRIIIFMGLPVLVFCWGNAVSGFLVFHSRLAPTPLGHGIARCCLRPTTPTTLRGGRGGTTSLPVTAARHGCPSRLFVTNKTGPARIPKADCPDAAFAQPATPSTASATGGDFNTYQHIRQQPTASTPIDVIIIAGHLSTCLPWSEVAAGTLWGVVRWPTSPRSDAPAASPHSGRA